MNPAMGKIVGQTGLFYLGMAISQREEKKNNSEFKLVQLRLKIDLVSQPARVEGLVNAYYTS